MSKSATWTGRHKLVVYLLLLVAPFTVGCGNSRRASNTREFASSELPDDAQLLRQLDEVLDFTFARRLTLRDHAAWQIVHGAVPFKRSFLVERDGELISAIDYVLGGGRMKGWEFVPGDMLGGRRGLRSVLQVGSKEGQGHPDQWLGYLSGCELSPDQPIVVEGTTYSMEDLIHQVEWDVPRNMTREYSWTLMGLSAYRPSSYEWTASDGGRWSIAGLVEIECEHDLNDSPCGGSHRLVGLTLALNRHLEQGRQLQGPWKLADEKIQQAIRTAREYQNPDGSFSTNYLQRPGTSPDVAHSLGTTGHILEFLVLALKEDQLREPWIKHAVVYLCESLRRTKDMPLECGALYHSASGLVLYRERLFGPRDFPAAADPIRSARPAHRTPSGSERPGGVPFVLFVPLLVAALPR